MIFKTTEELAKHVKITVSLDFKVIEPYVQAATDKYIAPYVGNKLLDKMVEFYELTPQNRAKVDNYKKLEKLLVYIQKTAAPFALLLATDETSINFGDTGHTVSRTTNLAPASDAKIKAYKHSLRERAWFNMEQLLILLEQDISVWPEWQNADSYTARKGNFFSSARSFQDKGLIDIQYSRLTFEMLRTPIQSIEVTELKELLAGLYPVITKSTYPSDDSAVFEELKTLVCRYLAHRVVCVFTTKSSAKQEVSNHDYIPVINTLHTGQNYSDNFYCEQASIMASQIRNFIILNAKALGVIVESQALNFNSDSRKIVEFLC